MFSIENADKKSLTAKIDFILNRQKLYIWKLRLRQSITDWMLLTGEPSLVSAIGIKAVPHLQWLKTFSVSGNKCVNGQRFTDFSNKF